MHMGSCTRCGNVTCNTKDTVGTSYPALRRLGRNLADVSSEVFSKDNDLAVMVRSSHVVVPSSYTLG